jgi:hypothetical protein
MSECPKCGMIGPCVLSGCPQRSPTAFRFTEPPAMPEADSAQAREDEAVGIDYEEQELDERDKRIDRVVAIAAGLVDHTWEPDDLAKRSYEILAAILREDERIMKEFDK